MKYQLSPCSASVAAALEAALAVTLLSPAPPLMFMGDEWGTRQPFPFFCDFKGDLANAVREGRRREFAEAYARHGDKVPDPLAPEAQSQTAFFETLTAAQEEQVDQTLTALAETPVSAPTRAVLRASVLFEHGLVGEAIEVLDAAIATGDAAGGLVSVRENLRGAVWP